ncbi:MAG: C40 family peptidase [Synechocystis sp.]|nr:C40 family peptidase [Synechocystis sp.]
MTHSVTVSLPKSPTGQFICQRNLDLFDQPDCQTLATQAAQGRCLSLTTQQEGEAIAVQQCEDNYPGWLPLSALTTLELATTPYQAPVVNREVIESRIPQVIAYGLQAKDQPNHYLWGGNIGPNFDCSGLMQGAFASQDIWLPRDSYQQAAFCETVVDVRHALPSTKGEIDQVLSQLLPGDLLFFGSQRIDHVGLYLGNGHYLHSSGKSRGRNGIGIDSLVDLSDPISDTYFKTWWYGGRIMESFDPQRHSLATTNITVDTNLLK